MGNTIISFIRTYVPLGVSALAAWIAVNYNINVGNDASAALGVGLTAVILAVYYALARALEKRWPKLGWLLGVPKQPEYAREVPPVAARLGASRYQPR